MGNCCSEDTITREPVQGSQRNSRLYHGQEHRHQNQNQQSRVSSSNRDRITYNQIDFRTRNRNMINLYIPNSHRSPDVSQEDRVMTMIMLQLISTGISENAVNIIVQTPDVSQKEDRVMTMIMLQLISTGISEENAVNIIVQIILASLSCTGGNPEEDIVNTVLQLISTGISEEDAVNIFAQMTLTISSSYEIPIIPIEDIVDIIVQLLEKTKVNREEIKKKQTRIHISEQQIYGQDHYNSDQTECPVCMEEFNDGDKIIVGSICHHISHYNCILEWDIQQENQGQTLSCPLDRQPI